MTEKVKDSLSFVIFFEPSNIVAAEFKSGSRVEFNIIGDHAFADDVVVVMIRIRKSRINERNENPLANQGSWLPVPQWNT